VRILTLDWGTVRIGVAISDPDNIIAFPLDRHVESKTAIDEIKKIISELKVEKVLIGMPRGLAGNSTESTKKVEKFASDLQNQIGPLIEFLDERFSSVAANKALKEEGMSEKEQRGIKDNIAAQLMLQSYLDSIK